MVNTAGMLFGRCGAILMWVAACLLMGGNVQAQSDGADFDRDVAPILIDHCLDCHSGAEPKGGLDLAVAELARKGGESGAAILPGKPDGSLLWERIDSGEMPPKGGLSEREKRTLREWISGGAN